MSRRPLGAGSRPRRLSLLLSLHVLRTRLCRRRRLRLTRFALRRPCLFFARLSFRRRHLRARVLPSRVLRFHLRQYLHARMSCLSLAVLHKAICSSALRAVVAPNLMLSNTP